MRRNRRNSHSGLEFGGSGEDSFVAVVVTKLTGALLFILLLTMVIMALLPKAIDLPSDGTSAHEASEAPPDLTITTPGVLPEAIAGRPYHLALAAEGGKGTRSWSMTGTLPDGLTFERATGMLQGVPLKGTEKPVELVVRVQDGVSHASRGMRLLVYQSDKPLTTPAWWKPGIPPVPWRAWLEQGFGFLLLWLIHLVGMNGLSNLRRWSLGALEAEEASAPQVAAAIRRFAMYRATIRLVSFCAFVGLGVWIWRRHG
ncbi:MAG: hypothetical protein NVSMB9_15470 [Isosphaeraceae bacterium]